MKRLFILIALFAAPAFAGLYPEWVSTATGALNYDFKSIATADFNGDGRPDLLLRESNRYVDVILGGDPSKVAAPVRIFTSDYITDVAIADVDGDGRPDVVVADIVGNTLSVLRSNGDGTFAAPVATKLPFSPTEIALGDVDGDHRTDVAIRSLSAAILAIYIGDGSGHFTERARTPISNAAYDMTSGDVDGDGKLDVVIARSDPSASGLDVYFGRGDGSFDGPTAIAAANSSFAIVVADLDGSGHLAILTTEFAQNTLTVYRNTGGRAFASPTTYFVALPNDDSPGNPGQPAVTDVDGDGKPDVVVPLANERSVATLIGNGDGSLRTPIYAFLPTTGGFVFPFRLVAGAFSGNGSHDLAVLLAASSGVMLLRNASGEVRVTLISDSPVVSQSQSYSMTARVDTAKGFLGSSVSPPFPSGTVTLLDGSSVLASGTPKNNVVRLTVPGLTTGLHSLVASFAGDDAFHSGASAPYVETVIAQTTTTTLTSDMPGTEVPFGYGTFSLTATLQTPIAGDTSGLFFLAIDGVRDPNGVSGPPAHWSPSFIHPGTHTFQAFYLGNKMQPPSASNIVTQVIKRATSSVSVDYGGFQVAAYRPLIVRVSIDGPSADTPNLGAITVLEGTKVLARTTITACCWSGGTSVDIPLPPWTDAGTHTIHATYDGDMDYAPSVSTDQQVLVTPGTPLHGHAARHQ